MAKENRCIVANSVAAAVEYLLNNPGYFVLDLVECHPGYEGGRPWATLDVSPDAVFPMWPGVPPFRGDTSKRGQSGVWIGAMQSDRRHALTLVINRARKMSA